MAAKRDTTIALWDERTLADPHALGDKAARVEAMFDAIAPSYERVNRVVSLGRDAAWRRRTVAAADPRPGEVVLDLCCGTGDLLRAFLAAQPRMRLLIGLDFAANMLALGRYAEPRAPVQLIRGDALRLPLADASVDIVSCAFGVRNFQRLGAGLIEARRVLRPGGRFVILEFALPANPLVRAGHQFYCNVILPRVAALISRDRSGAYRYLPQSIRTFEPAAAMRRDLQAAGFTDVTSAGMNLGSVVLYKAAKPAP